MRRRGTSRLSARSDRAQSGRVELPPGFPSTRLLLRPAFQHESLQPGAVRQEKRWSLGAQPGHLPQQNPSGRPHEPAVQHERLLLQAEGAGAQHSAEQESKQDGNLAARYRLHPGPADRLGLAPQHRQPPPPETWAKPVLQDSSHHPQHRHQHPFPTGVRVPPRDHVRRQQSTLWLNQTVFQ